MCVCVCVEPLSLLASSISSCQHKLNRTTLNYKRVLSVSPIRHFKKIWAVKEKGNCLMERASQKCQNASKRQKRWSICLEQLLQHYTESLRGFHYVPHTRSRVTQSLTVSMTTSLQLYSYSEFPFVLRDQRDKGEEGGESARLNGG